MILISHDGKGRDDGFGFRVVWPAGVFLVTLEADGAVDASRMERGFGTSKGEVGPVEEGRIGTSSRADGDAKAQHEIILVFFGSSSVAVP